jgi:hypothetical protein
VDETAAIHCINFIFVQQAPSSSKQAQKQEHSTIRATIGQCKRMEWTVQQKPGYSNQNFELTEISKIVAARCNRTVATAKIPNNACRCAFPWLSRRQRDNEVIDVTVQHGRLFHADKSATRV